MKLYFHPVSTTSRPVMMLAADSGIDLDYQVVDLFTGEYMRARWISNMKARPNWDKVNDAFYQYFVGPYKDGKFQGL